MKLFPATALALALAAAFPAQAQTNADILKELQALKDKVAELEGKLNAAIDEMKKDGSLDDLIVKWFPDKTKPIFATTWCGYGNTASPSHWTVVKQWSASSSTCSTASTGCTWNAAPATTSSTPASSRSKWPSACRRKRPTPST